MSWTIEANSSTYELPPAGTHGAVLVALIDLGKQWVEFEGSPGKVTPQVLLVWALPDSDNELVSKIYTLSLNQKSALRALVSGWRGKDLADGEKFDLSKLVGKTCMVSISHKTKGDKTSYKIESVSAVPKGMNVSKPEVAPVAISVGDDVPAWVPKIYGKTVQEYWEKIEDEGGEEITKPKSGSNSDDEVPF